MKFRVWDRASNCFSRLDLNDFYINHDGKAYELAEMYSSIANASTYDMDLLNDNYKIMLSTGLFDKNGIEIYEGDIIQVPHGAKFIVGDTAGFIFCEHGRFSYDNNAQKYVLTHDVVIGNIYEDKED